MQHVISQQQQSKSQRLNTEACPASVLNSQGKKAELMDRLNSKYEALHQQFEHERTLFERQLLDFEMLHFDIMDKELGLLGDNQRLMSIFRHSHVKETDIEDGCYGVKAFELGRGGFGITFLAWHYDDEQRNVVAVKIMRAKHLTDDHERVRFRNEALRLLQLSKAQAEIGAQYLPQFQRFGFLPIEINGGRTVQVPFLTMELISFTAKHLANRIMKPAADMNSKKKVDMVSWKTLALIARQVARALQWLHSQHFLHTDLKHDNIWWNGKGEAGIMDVGCAVELSGAQNQPICNWTATVSTHGPVLRYWLPEEVRHHKKAQVLVGPSMDWFAFGVWLVEMFYMVPRYQRRSDNSCPIRSVDDIIMPEIDKSIQHQALSLISSDVAGSVRAMIYGLLRPEPRHRPIGEQVLEVLDRLVTATVKNKNDKTKQARKNKHKKTRRGKKGGN